MSIDKTRAKRPRHGGMRVLPAAESSAWPSRLSPASSMPWLAGGAMALCAVYLLRNALLPFAIAGGVAFAVAPLVAWVQRRFSIARWAAGLLIYLALLAVFALAGFGLAWRLLPQTKELVGHFPTLLHAFLVRVLGGENRLIAGHAVSAGSMTDWILTSARRWTPGGGGGLAAVLVGFSAAMGVVLTLVLLGYFVIGGPRLSQGMLWLIPPRHRPRAADLAGKISPILGQYLRGMFFIGLYAVLFTWAVTALVLRLPSAFLLAVVVGMLEMIPVLGPVISTLAFAAIALEQITLPGLAGFVLYATALRVSIDQIVGPLVLGKTMRLPPPVILFSFIAGGVLLGTLGVLVAIPLAGAVKLVLQELYEAEAGASDEV